MNVYDTQILGLNGLNGVVNSETLTRGSRGEFLSFLGTGEVSDQIKQKIEAKKLKLADGVIYAIAEVDGKTVKMFQTQDIKEIGLRNIDRARLPKDTVLLVSAIQVLAAETVGELNPAGNAFVTKANDPEFAKAAKFVAIDSTSDSVEIISRVTATGLTKTWNVGDIVPTTETVIGLSVTKDGNAPFAGLETGLLTLRANRSDLVVDLPLTNFKHSENNRHEGYFKLDNPRLIQDDVEIECNIDLGVEVDADPNSLTKNNSVFLLVALHGTATIPA